jgi:hypothetical protein
MYVIEIHDTPEMTSPAWEVKDNRGRGISLEVACERLAEGMLEPINPNSNMFNPLHRKYVIKSIKEKLGIDLRTAVKLLE